MPTETQRVMVAVENAAARTFVADNLQPDGYEPLGVSCPGHASSRLPHRFEALIVDLGVDTIKLVDAVRADGFGSVDPQLPILVLTAGHDRFHPIRLLDRGADDVICEPWLYVEIRARLAAVLRRTSADRHRLNIAGESFVRNVWGVGYQLLTPA